MVGKLDTGGIVQQNVPVTNAISRGVFEEGKEQTIDQQTEGKSELSPEKAVKLTEGLNKVLETSNSELRFEFHDELKEYYVTIVNSNKEVIREIPSKKLMDVFAAMQKFVGILVDRKI